jgi:NAD(P)-dependent dehydrogenase (short-subunit alcohol dehydrogenase family)
VTDQDRSAPVVVVTGASRGAGKGIALALGEIGATVYVTGRTRNQGDARRPGSVTTTAEEIDRRGGTGVAVVCDHADDEQVRRLFEQVERDHGRLDILVNNAYALPAKLTAKGPFWEKPLDLQAQIEVGLRSSYVSSYYAAPLLTKPGSGGGLVANTSSYGGRCYMHGPAYGAVKAGVDKMAHDMAIDLKPFDVAAVAVWMGILRTEQTEAEAATLGEHYRELWKMSESAEFTGRVLAALWRHPDRMSWTGQVHIGAELGEELGVLDVDGSAPRSHRPMLGDPPVYSTTIVN